MEGKNDYREINLNFGWEIASDPSRGSLTSNVGNRLIEYKDFSFDYELLIVQKKYFSAQFDAGLNFSLSRHNSE